MKPEREIMSAFQKKVLYLEAECESLLRNQREENATDELIYQAESREQSEPSKKLMFTLENDFPEEVE